MGEVGRKRALSLDALRGLAILGMCLSGIVPRYLPNWMYHGYYPQYLPDEAGVWQRVDNPWQFHDWSAFTWVDWVFPMFLFAMGAAFPLAMAGRLEAGVSRWKLAIGIVQRWLLLVGFAVLIRQFQPGFIAGGFPSTAGPWLLALAGFAALMPMFLRLPKAVPRWAGRLIRLGGWAAAVGLVVGITFYRNQPFAWNQFDIIILLLAHMSLVGALVWLFTPGRLWPLRLLVLLPAYLAHHQAMEPRWRWFGGTFDGWMPWLQAPTRWLDLTWIAETPWLDLSPLYDFTWYKFLWVVIPATIVGDRLHAALKSDQPLPTINRRLAATAMLLLAAIVAIHVGLVHHRATLIELPGGELTWSWLIAAAALPLAGVALRLADGHGTSLLRSLIAWSLIWLAVGLLVEPWEGGIKKGPPATLSYYAITIGLSIALTGALVVLIDGSRFGRRAMSWLVLTGQNPMLAYAAIRNVLAPVVHLPLLTPVNTMTDVLDHDSINATVNEQLLDAFDADGQPLPWLRFSWAAVQTLGLAAATALATRLRIIWRS